MSFHPNPKDELTINNSRYFVAEHPSAPGMPYGQEGRMGIVYRLVLSDRSEDQALKLFKPRFRLPYLVSQAEKLSVFANLPGLQAARRTVLTPTRHAELLRQYPDLTYAVLMPWLDGPTWLDILLEKTPILVERSLSLARALAEILVRMEEGGLAHCDLSGPNVMLPVLAGGTGIALIDLEGFYAPGMIQPQSVSSGSAGYTHQKSGGGSWRPEADRFAGAVLLAEILGWCDEQVCQASWGESYFEPAEMQQECARYHSLHTSLRNHWGDGVASLFERAWRSDSLTDCPTFGEWLVVLPLRSAPAAGQEQKPETPPGETKPLTIKPPAQGTPGPEASAPVQEESMGKARTMMFPEVEITATPSTPPPDTGRPKSKPVEEPNVPARPQPTIQRKRQLPVWAIMMIVLIILAGFAVISFSFLRPQSSVQFIPTSTQSAVIPVIPPTATEFAWNADNSANCDTASGRASATTDCDTTSSSPCSVCYRRGDDCLQLWR